MVKCLVVADAWNVLEEGCDLNLVCTYSEAEFFETVSSVLIRLPVQETFPYENKEGDKGYGMLFGQSLNFLGCFPLEDGKVKLDIMEAYLKANNLKLNYVGNPTISSDPDYVYCTFDDVASIVDDEMAVETAVENLRDVYERYQTGEYNYISADLVSKMTYGDYCRMMEGTLTKEDFKKYGLVALANGYAGLPPLFSKEFSLSDGTKFEISTRVEIPDSYLPKMIANFESFEKQYTDENGVLNSKSCVEAIQALEGYYGFMAIIHAYGSVNYME